MEMFLYDSGKNSTKESLKNLNRVPSQKKKVACQKIPNSSYLQMFAKKEPKRVAFDPEKYLRGDPE